MESGQRKLIPQTFLSSDLATSDDKTVLVEQGDFIKALRELVPSVSEKEMEEYRRVQEKFSGDKEKEKEKDREMMSEGNKSKGKGKAREM
jgi:peroxin-6